MRQIVTEPQLLNWAAHVQGGTHFREDAKCIGLVDGDHVHAVVVYDNFCPSNCNMHIASDGSRRWLNRAFLMAGFHYPFVQAGLRRVTGLVPAKNTQALRFDMKLGFEVEGRLKNALPDDDIILLGMLRENCLFIPKEVRHGRR